MSKYLTEAFKALEDFDTDFFSISDDGISKLDAFIDGDTLDDSVHIIDPEAESDDDIQDSYLGKVILSCPVCDSKIYKDSEEITINDEEELANVGEECPYCRTADGFNIIGQVAKYGSEVDSDANTDADDDTNANTKDDEPKEAEDPEEDTDDLDESLKDKVATRRRIFREKFSKKTSTVTEGLESEDGVYNPNTDPERLKKAPHIAFSDEHDRDSNDFVTEELIEKCGGFERVDNRLHDIANKYPDVVDNISDFADTSYDDSFGITSEEWHKVVECVVNKTNKLNEGFNNVNVETNDQKLSMTQDDSGKVTIETEPISSVETGDEIIAPIDDTLKAEIENNTEDPEEPGSEEIDFNIDDFSEEDFDGLGESYLKEIYNNVKSYKTTSVSSNDKALKLEGVIKFNSGKAKKTSFIFEAKNATKDGRVSFIGENTQITKGKKAFKLVGRVDNNKFLAESFNYNYKVKDSETGKSRRVYGTLKVNK